MSKSSLKSDFLAMNVSWYPNELELYTNQASITMSTIFTTIVILTFLMGVVVQKSVFKLLKRLPQRAINQIIYPYMVKTLGSLHKLRLHFLTFDYVRIPPSLHFLCSNSGIFLTTYPPLNANVICEGSLILYLSLIKFPEKLF